MALPEILKVGERVQSAASPDMHGTVEAVDASGLVEVHWDDANEGTNNLLLMHWLTREKPRRRPRDDDYCPDPLANSTIGQDLQFD